MKLEIKDQPREFEGGEIKIKDFGKVHLGPDEMISVVSRDGKECDITAKEWGFYLAPSINARLKDQGLKVALVQNETGKLFINAVKVDKMRLFQKYLKTGQNSRIVAWLDEWS